MPTQRRSRDATESTLKTNKDRPAGRSASDSDRAKSRAATTSKDKESDSASSSDTGRVTRADKKEVVAESTTKATAIVKPKEKPKAKIVEPVRTFAQCPHCHERRYKPEQYGTTVKCTNCRVTVVLR